MIALPHWIGGSYTSQSPLAACMKTVNFYKETLEVQGGFAKSALYPTPGVLAIGQATSSPGKAHIAAEGREFAVQGTEFNEYNSGGAVTNRGAVAVDGNPATISYNGNGGRELFITSGGNGYLFDLATDTFSAIPALAGKATMGDYSDAFFHALDAATSTWYISNALDGATWNPTQFAQPSATPGPWKALKVSKRFVYLFGPDKTEVWYNAGLGGFPYVLHPSGVLEYGIVAPFSPEVVDGTLHWLGATINGQGVALRAGGFTPESISTYPLQFALSGYPSLADALGESYEELGHTFYVLTFPSAGATWCWDTREQEWAERGTWDVATGTYGAWRPMFHAFVFGEHRWLDIGGGSLYRMSSLIATDAGGGPIRRLRRAPAFEVDNRLLSYPGFELLLEPGLGLSSGQGSDPQVMLRISKDGGKTFGNELSASAGAQGEYGKRVRFLRCGSGRHLVFEVAMTDPIVNWRVMGANAIDFERANAPAA